MTDLTRIVLSALGLIAGTVTAFLIPLIRSKLSETQREKLRFWINVAVNAFEQTIRGEGMGEKRKAAVLEFLHSRGITVNTDEIDAMIEAEVNKLRG